MKRTFNFFYMMIFASLFFSCKSAKEIEYTQLVPPMDPPPMVTQIPLINFSGAGIRYEFENMMLNDFLVMFDENASGKFSARILNEGSTAQLKVWFPAGTYECMIAEKSFFADRTAFYLYIDNVPYRMFLSNYTAKNYELTTRTPVYFTLNEPRTILFTIQANSDLKSGDTGMNLDYIQFVKR